MTLAACGGGGAAGTTAGAPAPADRSGAPEPSTHPGGGPPARGAGQRAAARSGAEGSGCEARLANFLDRMDDLRQSLLAGLSYSEYVVRVQGIRAAYEAIPVDRLGAACLAGPAGKAEEAFNQYLRAANAWGECAATAGCAASEVEGSLQRRWRIASKNLDAAGRRP